MYIQQSPLVLALLTTFTLACGGGDGGGSDSSGVDTSKSVSALSDAETTTLCEWSVDMQGGEGTSHDCGDGVSVDIESPSECVSSVMAFGDCALTVAQYEECTIALADSPCTFGGSACAPLFDCF